ncbi:MFS transporter [Neorhizobium sp. BETTINA12A]|uniref:MFS transporter n=1 Tax=Neorhizobium sp. BETTINA12A TaxID=2908924 RepID=UPI001FF26897|nr:MFS transporter [Neorhizobium sp. BETTINA12A]
MDRPSKTSQARARQPHAALATLCLAVITAQLDTSVVNLALDPIGKDLDATVSQLQWVVDAYNLVYAVLLLTGGLLADLAGRRRILISGALVFGIASIGCAVAPTAPLLIAARALTGVGAALLLPASLSIIRVIYPDQQARQRALGIWAACNGLALAIGPTLGGLLIYAFGWRSVFYVVVPFSLVGAVSARATIEESADPAGRSFDISGQVLAILSLATVTLAAIESPHSTMSLTAAFGVTGFVLFGLFLAVEHRQGQAALVPLTMFRSKSFTGAMAGTTAMTFGMYGTLFLFPLATQSLGRLDATSTGLALLPMALSFVLVSPFSDAVVQHFGQRVTIALGLATIGIGNGILSVAFMLDLFMMSEIGLLLTGIGMGLATGPLTAVAVSAVGSNRGGTAGALINVARMVGATIGVAALGAIFAAVAGAENGFFAAMIVGALVQVMGAAVALSTIGR